MEEEIDLVRENENENENEMHSHLILIVDLLQLLLLTGFSYAVGLCKHRHIVLLTKSSPKIKLIETTALPAERWTLVIRIR